MVKKDVGEERYTYRLKFLYQHNIVDKDSKPSVSTVNRLYGFYQKNSLDTPLYLAYGLRKRINKRVNKYGGEYKLSTPKGKVSVEKYIKSEAESLAIVTSKQISSRASFKSGIYRQYLDRLQDYLNYSFHITCNEEKLGKVLSYVHKNIMPLIRADVEVVIKNFLRFYHTPLVGSVAVFTSHDFGGGYGENYQRVAYTRIYRDKYIKLDTGISHPLNFFMDCLFESIKNGFLVCLAYNNFTITFTKLEIVFTSDKIVSAYEKLRA